MAKGDLFVRNAAGSFELLTVGSDGTYLKADAAQTLGFTWGTPSGSGDVVGPSSSSNQAVAIFDDTTGKLLDDLALPTSTTQYLKCASTGPPVTYEWAAPSASVTLYPSPDYYFYNDSGTYKALNAHTGSVDYSGATCSTVLQSTMNNIISTWGHGAIYFRPGDTFTFTAGVSHSTGNIFLFSNGAHLDIASYDGVIFDLGSDSTFRRVGNDTSPAYLTGISGFTVEGANWTPPSTPTHTSEKLIIIRNICNAALVENIKFAYCYNLVEIRGGCYSAIVRGVNGAYAAGTFVKFTYTSTGGTANAASVTDCQISNSNSNGNGEGNATSKGIDNGGGEGDYADGLIIQGNWIENHNIAIRNGGIGCIIEGNNLSADQGTAPKNIHLIASAMNTLIEGNYMTPVSGGYGIYSDATGDVQSHITITGNTFGYAAGTCIYNNVASSTYGMFLITNNSVVFDSSGTEDIFFSGDLVYSTISGNRLNGGRSVASTMINLGTNSTSSTIASNMLRGFSNTTTTLISGTGSYMTIVGNTFARATVALSVANLTNSLIGDNVVTSTVTTAISGTPGSGTVIRNLIGDATYQSVIGPASSTEHALAVYDGATGKIIESIAVPTATNQYLKCATTGPPVTYEWATVSGSGDVVGPAGATANAIARYDGGTGKLIKDSAVTVADTVGSLVPAADNTGSLGSVTNGWGRLYLGAATTYKIHAGGTVQFRTMDDSAYRSIDVLSLSIGGTSRIDSSGNGIFYGVNLGAGAVFPNTDLGSSVGKSTNRFPALYMGHATAPTIRSDTEFRFRDIADTAYQLIDVLSLKVGGTSVIDSSRNMANVGTLGCGAITSSGALGLGANAITCGGITHSADIVPSADNVRSLGSGSAGYLKIYMSQTGASKILGSTSLSIRNTTDTLGLTLNCGQLGCTAVSQTGGAENSFAGTIQPGTTDATYDLGKTSYGWANLFLGAATSAKIRAGVTIQHRNHADSADQAISCAGITNSGDIVPSTDNARSLGSATYGFAKIYLPNSASGKILCGATPSFRNNADSADSNIAIASLITSGSKIMSSSTLQIRNSSDVAYQALDCLSLSIGGSAVINSSGIITNQVVSLNFIINGGGAAITTGKKGTIEVPFAMTITGWTIIADQSGSIVVDVNRSTYSGFPTTSSIAGTELPTLSTAQKNQDLSLSTWTTSIAAGDILEFEVDSVSTCQRVTVSIRGTRA